jgi:hypothetical protein
MKQKENWDIRPTPILKGKNAKRFYAEINDKEMSDKQKKFIEECLSLLHR